LIEELPEGSACGCWYQRRLGAHFPRPALAGSKSAAGPSLNLNWRCAVTAPIRSSVKAWRHRVSLGTLKF